MAIARALVRDPSLILADEPTSILDEEMTKRVMEIFSELHQRGKTILFATQDHRLIQHYPNRVVPLTAGKKEGPEGSEKVKSQECSLS